MMIHSFLLIGQSNMAGRGFFDEAIEVDSSRISVLRNGRWMPMYRPVNNDRSFSGVNLAEKFAELYAKKYNVMVGLIPCADGGTRLDQWEPGSLLFDHAVFQAKLAQRSSTSAGVLWHQGEHDAFEGNTGENYHFQFTMLINSLRERYNIPNLPFICGSFVSDWRKKNEEICAPILAALQQAAQDMQGEYVDASDLLSNNEKNGDGDDIHFCRESLHILGRRYFQSYIKWHLP